MTHCNQMIDVSVLTSRMALLESRLYGPSKEIQQRDLGFLPDRVRRLQGRVGEIEKEVGSLIACQASIAELRPLLMKRQSQLSSIITAINDLVAKREQIISWINDLTKIKELSAHINVDDYGDIAALSSRLAAVEASIQALGEETARQTASVDILLDSYDAAMDLLSRMTAKWDKALRLVENES